MIFPSRSIGQTQVKTSHVSFGCSGIGNLYHTISDEDAQALLHHAYTSGIRYFDTAPHYGRGLSEARLGQFIASQNDIVISTKVGRVLTPGAQRAEADGFINPLPNDVHYDYSADGIAQSLASSKTRLGRDYIDIIYVHDIGQVTHGAQNDKHLSDLLNTGLPYLKDLQKQGHIGAIGLGVNENEICIDIMQHFTLDVILLAGRWTLLDRSAEQTLIPLCRKSGTSIVLGGIFNSGILATGPKEGATFDYETASPAILQQVRDLEINCTAQGTTLPDAALHFAMTRDIAASVLIGTSKQSSLDRNLQSILKDYGDDHPQYPR